ncbi:hypothetical protein RI129_003036 [Pyrocoelia pectoralis]|uniref:Regulatory protein zeste n=1 Tax=Pyrocoelia pectoralis TaxID=417401 RepID=A0AAN7VN50_9COLE
MPGPKKNWTAWRRTWQDLKKNAKKRNTEVKQYARGTGGGPPFNPIFTKEESTILHILDQVEVEGDATIQESCVIWDVSVFILKNYKT